MTNGTSALSLDEKTAGGLVPHPDPAARRGEWSFEQHLRIVEALKAYGCEYLNGREEYTLLKEIVTPDSVTGLINQLVPEEERLMVFPRGGPYLATKKIGKNNPKEEEIRKTNALRQEWNAAVSEALSRGVPTGDLIQMKKELIVEPVTRSIRKNGKDPELFILILRKAIKLLIEKARTFRPSVLASLERMKEKAKQQNTKRNERAPEGKILERQSRRMSTPGR